MGLVLALRILLRVDGASEREASELGRLLPVLHGLAGASGLGLLIVLLQGPRQGDAMGVGSFGAAAAVLFGLALAAGPLRRLLRGRSSDLVLISHAAAAITGFVLFLAWRSFG